MIAARRFALEVEPDLASLQSIKSELFGSLALTGLGHRTDRALIAGLAGHQPHSVDPDSIEPTYQTATKTNRLTCLGKYTIDFKLERDLVFHPTKVLPEHPNGLRFTASFSGKQQHSSEYYSVGGGFVVRWDEIGESPANIEGTSLESAAVPYPFCTAEELISRCLENNLSIAELVHHNELALQPAENVSSSLDEIWSVMTHSIDVGCATEGILPGGLEIRRRAPEVFKKLKQKHCLNSPRELDGLDPLQAMDWVTLFALAVNEQNAAGGRVVTAPTNGAAGVIPAVASYYDSFLPGATRNGIHTFLMTAAAIGMLYKRNASLSAAEMGCQGEVGVACSMAAAGLAAVMGGTPQQVENAAEIGMEHNLGLTCDPVAGLVQVPCIERNTMGAIKAINAARLAVLYGDGKHRVSLDRVIETMRQTGVDMQSKYKETSQGGLAVNVINC